jgi:phage FluMu gp28-like protein
MWARQRKDFSSVWINHAGRDGKKRLVALVLMQNTEFATQRHILTQAMRARAGSVGAGDATGLGFDSNETMKALFRDNWEGVVFGVKSKSDLGSLGRTAFGDGVQKLPEFASDGHDLKFIATDLYSIQCVPTGDAADKRLALSETENELEPDSHCDIAYSGLLALKAGTLVGGRLGPRHAGLEEVPVGW